MDRESFRSNNVHLWLADLDVADRVYFQLKEYLSPDERKRADQFDFSQGQRNFITARGMLRSILAGYLNCRPGDVVFRYSPDGKPAVNQQELPMPVDFNLSHSSGRLVVAVTQGLNVGVDIEYVKILPEMDLIASHSFSASERKAYSQLPDEEKSLGFYRCWTRKEAYLKAIGNGLSMPLDSFDVSLAPENPIHMLSNRIDPEAVSHWSFYTFIPLRGFIGALVVEAQEVRPCFHPWKPGMM